MAPKLKKVFLKNINQEMDDLAHMLFEAANPPNPMLELIQPSRFDFTLASLTALEGYFERVKDAIADDDARIRLILRSGAYVGEVIRRHAALQFTWYDYKDAVKFDRHLNKLGYSLGTRAVLVSDAITLFPLSKVLNFLEHGPADSLHYFAAWAIQEGSDGKSDNV